MARDRDGNHHCSWCGGDISHKTNGNGGQPEYCGAQCRSEFRRDVDRERRLVARVRRWASTRSAQP